MAGVARPVRVADHPAAVEHRIQAEAPPAEAADRIAEAVVVEVGAVAPTAVAVVVEAVAISKAAFACAERFPSRPLCGQR